ncbi:hypothetical protein E1267_13375 [Nonomuraea longispora]|uniref:Uncharacterized protein n=1 Tax=Nonomuraea longispora TaxID=1848320 RepID=A0A4R4NIL0_9ACTN|nr:hypothetical protein [Nonomuraea longispora]TDC07460.1 hypothetical protein E1267_13375 [Nonomuraea longispora]
MTADVGEHVADAVRPWSFGIATNLVAGHRRKEARHYRPLSRSAQEPAAEGHENSVVTSVSAQRMQPRPAQAPASLSKGEREVLLLVGLGQLSYD